VKKFVATPREIIPLDRWIAERDGDSALVAAFGFGNGLAQDLVERCYGGWCHRTHLNLSLCFSDGLGTPCQPEAQ
jgi:hypothetical protein